MTGTDPHSRTDELALLLRRLRLLAAQWYTPAAVDKIIVECDTAEKASAQIKDLLRLGAHPTVLAYLAGQDYYGSDEVTRILDWHATQEQAGMAVDTLIDTYDYGVADSWIACAATEQGKEHVMTNPHREAFPVGLGDIAHMLGVTRGTVDAWHGRRRRQTGFPPPDMTISGRPAWWAETIIDWALWSGRLEVKLSKQLPVAKMQADGRVTVVWPEKGES